MKKYLESDIMRLRAPELSDAVVLFEWENNSEDWHSSNRIFGPQSLYNIEEHIKNCINNPFSDGELRLMVELKSAEKPIGTLELTGLNPISGNVTLGFYISPEYRNLGHGTEMIRLVIEYCISYLGIRTIVAETSSKNIGAQNILEKNGFQIAGKLKKWLRSPDGNLEDVLVYQYL